MLSSMSKTAAIVIPCSMKIGEPAIAWPEPAGADEGDVVLPLRAQDLPDLGEQAVDRVPDPALAELAEVGEVAADLGRVDVRVVGDLLRRDPLLAHLLRLGQHLEVAREPRRDADADAILERTDAIGLTLQHERRIVHERMDTAFTSSQTLHRGPSL